MYIRRVNRSTFEEPTEILDKMYNPMALPAVIGDTMYLHQAMKQPDQAQFLKVIVKIKIGSIGKLLL